MTCMLRIYGDDVDTDELKRASPVPPQVVFRKGEPRSARPNATREPTSGMYLVVSEADFDSLWEQQNDAIAFLKTHRDAIAHMLSIPGISTVTLDFGVARRRVAAQYDRFCVDLLREAAHFGIDLELSQYEVSSRRKPERLRKRHLRGWA